MEAFELRLWDGRIGRWLTVDPYAQYDSPYLGMGNNPVNMIDPDGGFANPIFGSDGNFRGFDDRGNKGEAIIYDGKFKNGMKQENILKNGGLFATNFFFKNSFTVGQVREFNSKMINSINQKNGKNLITHGKIGLDYGITIGTMGSAGAVDDLARGGKKFIVDKLKKQATSLIGNSGDIAKFSEKNVVLNNVANPGGYSKLSNNKVWDALITKYTKNGITNWDKVNNIWFKKLNTPWLKEIVKRKDNLKVVSKINRKNLYNTVDGKIDYNQPRHFLRELKFLKSKGYIIKQGNLKIK